jgi:hypothetical protein
MKKANSEKRLSPRITKIRDNASNSIINAKIELSVLPICESSNTTNTI